MTPNTDSSWRYRWAGPRNIGMGMDGHGFLVLEPSPTPLGPRGANTQGPEGERVEVTSVSNVPTWGSAGEGRQYGDVVLGGRGAIGSLLPSATAGRPSQHLLAPSPDLLRPHPSLGLAAAHAGDRTSVYRYRRSFLQPSPPSLPVLSPPLWPLSITLGRRDASQRAPRASLADVSSSPSALVTHQMSGITFAFVAKVQIQLLVN